MNTDNIYLIYKKIKYITKKKSPLFKFNSSSFVVKKSCNTLVSVPDSILV
jgi:hypothetical protein